MGIRLAMAAQSPAWSGLSDRAYRVLTYMCTTALDTPSKGRPAGEYTGGHTMLAQRLRGRDDVTPSDLEVIRRAIKELREAGAITIARPAYGRTVPTYRLDVTGLPNQDQLDF